MNSIIRKSLDFGHALTSERLAHWHGICLTIRSFRENKRTQFFPVFLDIGSQYKHVITAIVRNRFIARLYIL
jgi:hypothetical protein